MQKESILLVDDEPAILETCKISLERGNFKVFTSPSGDKALDILKNTSTDVLVTDISMPGLSGVELLREAKAIHPDMPVAIITGFGNMELVMECMRLGAQDFIMKPFSPAELRSTIHNLIERNRILKENLRLKTIMPLLEVNRQLIEKVEMNDILKLVVSESLRGVKGHCASIMLCEEERFEIVAQVGLPKRSSEEMDPVDSLAKSIIKAKKSVIFRDGGKAWNELHYANKKTDVSLSITVPILVEERGVGLLNVGRAEGAGEFTEGDIEYLNILANHLSAAMERSRLYKKLAEALEDAREADRTKDAFLANISHEFRTPLNSIIGFSELLLEDDSEERISSDQLQDLRIIHDKGQDLLKLFEDLMDVTLLETGAIKLKKEKICCSSFLTETFRYFEERGETKGLSMELDMPEEKISIMVDGYFLRKILANLLDNAVKFTKTGTIYISLAKSNGDLLFKIGDTGIGIDSRDMKLIFDKFRQVDDSFSRRFEGAGLGLYTAKKFTELMGGELEVESPWVNEGGIVENGSLFLVSLPAQ